MTGADLRSVIDEELSGLEPMPTVVPSVLTQGRRRERRRRWAGVGVAAAATVGVIAGSLVASGVLDSDAAAPGPAVDGPRAAQPPQTHTRAEFARWAAPRFEAALPERFGTVRTTEHNDFVIHVNGARVMFNLNIRYVYGKHSNIEPGGIDLRPRCDDSDYDTCASQPRLRAVAYHDGGRGGDYASLQMNVTGRYDGVDQVAVNLFGRPQDGSVPLTDAEILDLAGSPQFDSIIEEYAAHPGWPSSFTYVKPEGKPFRARR